MELRRATEEDLAFIEGLEARPEYAPFINHWTVERHALALADPDFGYRILDEDGQRQGYAILTGLTSPNRAVGLMRFALERAGEGRGRACVRLLLAEVFERLGAHRFFLDLFEGNARAEHLYASLGFRFEGVLRDAEFKEGAFRSLRVMSILEDEYRALGFQT